MRSMNDYNTMLLWVDNNGGGGGFYAWRGRFVQREVAS